MADKLHEYTGYLGWFHEQRDGLKERYSSWKDQHKGGFSDFLKTLLTKKNERTDVDYTDYSHLYRQKTRKELMRISMAVTGIEFSYAAETAFVSPTLLKIGVEHQNMTLVWALSPLIGFFLTPIFGSLSDRCPLKFGRRRPFIVLLSIGVVLGLILVPNGENLGLALGDIPSWKNVSDNLQSAHRTSAKKQNLSINYTKTYTNTEYNVGYHPWGIFFTILGTILLDFNADACQSPARAYLLDVTIPDDHAKGLSTFTIMAGLGGTMGYAMGGINWDATFIGMLLGGHVKAVFSLITVIFIICVICTITSFEEMPLETLQMPVDGEQIEVKQMNSEQEKNNILGKPEVSYGTLVDETGNKENKVENLEEPGKIKLERAPSLPPPPPDATLLVYLQSIVFMPRSLLMLCLTNLFCWMAHVCYSLYFTDFVGEAVFNGIPTAPEDSIERMRYEEGVRFGCWGMAMYSLSCACYSTVIEKLIHKFGAKRVYIAGLLIYSIGMFFMAITKDKMGVILFSWTAGVMYSTLFTMPFLLVAHYHAKGVFETNPEGQEKVIGQVRGLGTDLAIVSSMVFLAQFILSLSMGTIVRISKTTTAVVSVASFLAFCGAISAKFILYLDL